MVHFCAQFFFTIFEMHPVNRGAPPLNPPLVSTVKEYLQPCRVSTAGCLRSSSALVDLLFYLF